MFFVCHLHDISQANETAEPEISVMTSPEKQPEPGWDITPHYRFAQAFESHHLWRSGPSAGVANAALVHWSAVEV